MGREDAVGMRRCHGAPRRAVGHEDALWGTRMAAQHEDGAQHGDSVGTRTRR